MANEKKGTLEFLDENGNYVPTYPKTSLDQVEGGQSAIDTAKASAINTAKTNADGTYPKKDGTGATGSWAISITGNAKTATTSSACSGNSATATKATSAETAGTCTGNAATATKLATARTIALSGDATGSATFDGSGNATIATTLARTVGLTDLCPDGSAAHNCFYRGKDITADFTSGKMSTNIANGTFRDIFPGDYIVKSVTVNGTAYNNVKFVVGDCDYYYNMGDSALSAHHVLMVPDTIIGSTRMNATHTTEGGYAGSEMWKTTIPLYATGLQNAFGSSHIVSHRVLLSKAVNADYLSNAGMNFKGAAEDNWETWYDVVCNLMNEMQVYGSLIFTSSAGEARSMPHQISAFRHSNDLRNAHRNLFWLTAVVASGAFSISRDDGTADCYGANDSFGVRPYFLLR